VRAAITSRAVNWYVPDQLRSSGVT
jgi:hypothetical protein